MFDRCEKETYGSTAFANAEKGRHLFGSKEMFRAKVESMLKRHVSIDQCYVRYPTISFFNIFYYFLQI